LSNEEKLNKNLFHGQISSFAVLRRVFHPSRRNVFLLKLWVKIAVLGVAGMEKKNAFNSNY